jgi:hypothetical protein
VHTDYIFSEVESSNVDLLQLQNEEVKKLSYELKKNEF